MLLEEIKQFFKGDVAGDEATLQKYSHDASLFEVRPELVVFPKDVEDLKNLVRFVNEKKETQPSLSLTARSGGTDMSGGPLNESIIVDFTKYFNHLKEVGAGYAITEPGVFYRDFYKETLKQEFFLPSYPASREICTVGGMAANNAGGEKNLKYGKTENYIEMLKVVMSDGNEYVLKPLNKGELDEKMKLQTFEGEIYRKLYKLAEENYDLIQRAKPAVSKNSAGYYLWNVWDKERFDITQLFTGSQGTLGIITEIKFRLVKEKSYSGLLVIFLKNLSLLTQVVKEALRFQPSAFESFDDHTLKLALRFLPSFLRLLGAKNLISLSAKFLPEFLFILRRGMPKLILLVEFEEDSQEGVEKKLRDLKARLDEFRLENRVAKTKEEANKYWTIRRESFNLLRNKIKDKRTTPFIDDVIVNPEDLPEFLPKLYEILDRYQLLYTIAGHAGDGNFHIIPLMNLGEKSEREKIPKVAEEVYRLVFTFRGSITAEHNDGLIRSPYLEKMYGTKVYQLFEEVKNIFDPKNIFNPGKKVGADLSYALRHIKTH